MGSFDQAAGPLEEEDVGRLGAAGGVEDAEEVVAVGLEVRLPEDADQIGQVWQPHLEAYGKNLLHTLDAFRRPEPAYVFFLKGPGRLIPGPHFDVVVDRPRYAILRLRESD